MESGTDFDKTFFRTLSNLADCKTCREKNALCINTLADSYLETFAGSHLETNFTVLKISKPNF